MKISKIILYPFLIIGAIALGFYSYTSIKYNNTYSLSKDCNCSQLSYQNLPPKVRLFYDEYSKLKIDEKQSVDYKFLSEANELKYYSNVLFKKDEDIFDFWYMGKTQNLLYKNKYRLILNGVNFPFSFIDKKLYYPAVNRENDNFDYQHGVYSECAMPF